MEKNHNASKRGKPEVEKGIGSYNGNAGGSIETNNAKKNGEERLGLLKELVSLNSEVSKLQMEHIETEDSIVHELMRLSGLIAQLRMLDSKSLTNDVISDFDSLFDKYLKKLKM
jgi:hypothetical protein